MTVVKRKTCQDWDPHKKINNFLLVTRKSDRNNFNANMTWTSVAVGRNYKQKSSYADQVSKAFFLNHVIFAYHLSSNFMRTSIEKSLLLIAVPRFQRSQVTIIFLAQLEPPPFCGTHQVYLRSVLLYLQFFIEWTVNNCWLLYLTYGVIFRHVLCKNGYIQLLS